MISIKNLLYNATIKGFDFNIYNTEDNGYCGNAGDTDFWPNYHMFKVTIFN